MNTEVILIVVVAALVPGLVMLVFHLWTRPRSARALTRRRGWIGVIADGELAGNVVVLCEDGGIVHLMTEDADGQERPVTRSDLGDTVESYKSAAFTERGGVYMP